VAITYTSREQIEVYRFSLPVSIIVPLLALFLQAFVPLRLRFFEYLDLPLLITIFFAVARRNQISGLLTGGVIGLIQDSLTHHPIGIYGIAKTVVGFAASSLGVRIDAENPGSRVLLTFGFYLLHQLIYFTVARGMLQQKEVWQWQWGHELIAGALNAALAVVLFFLLDRLKQRA
jgi:rod shape-determining protein MreD